MNKPILLVNFGGPRTLDEVAPFLCELLTDVELIRPKLPSFLHRALFRRIAKKRARKVSSEYHELGGGSPIYKTTEDLAHLLREKSRRPVLTFHRYLPATHRASLAQIAAAGELLVLPLFPQFSYTTTGSIARFFAQHLPATKQLRWVKSYPAHPAFIDAYAALIRDFLARHSLAEKETHFLFSAHGIPRSYAEEGDPYDLECQQSVAALMHRFPGASHQLAFQSQFGPAEWLRPYTGDLCEQPFPKPNVVIIPLSFSSDHLETLIEIEKLYLPPIKAQGFSAYRCPALNLNSIWIDALLTLANETNLCTNNMLIRSTV